MGEYIKIKGENVKLGTCQELLYATFDQVKQAVEEGAEYCPGNAQPRNYLNPECGWRYRFPFPDEDDLAIGTQDFTKGWLLPCSREWFGQFKSHSSVALPVPGARQSRYRQPQITLPCPFSELAEHSGIVATWALEVIQQKQAEGCLCTVVRCLYCKQVWRLDREDAEKLCAGVGILPGDEEVCKRILDGYRRKIVEDFSCNT